MAILESKTMPSYSAQALHKAFFAETRCSDYHFHEHWHAKRNLPGARASVARPGRAFITEVLRQLRTGEPDDLFPEQERFIHEPLVLQR
jgi:hypothetical protein